MPKINPETSLARVRRLLAAATRHGQKSVDVDELEFALEGDIGLSVPRSHRHEQPAATAPRFL